MQKGPSQVTSGSITPAISGPKKDRDVLVVSGLIVSLAAVIGTFWYYSSSEYPANQDQLNGSQVSEVLKNNQPLVTPVSLTTANIHEELKATSKPGIIHTDLYFEIGRKGLTDEAKKLLQEQATILKNDENLGVLVQGYTDQQGSTSYNLKLGMKRAETVKTELLNVGVAEHQIKIVSLGKDGVPCIDMSDVCRHMNRRVHLEIRTIGVPCIDMSDVCRHMNRRVHLEIRTIGREHMVPPSVATTPEVEATQASIEPNQKPADSDSLTDGLIPSANASEPEGPAPNALEPGSGS